jgi:polypeptide N-acetylgalactosaminyltransferase
MDQSEEEAKAEHDAGLDLNLRLCAIRFSLSQPVQLIFLFWRFPPGFNKHKFNQHKSDRLPLRRPQPDVRHADCKAVTYDIDQLPKTSIIILFHNEARSTLLRTVWTALDNSPPELIHEILLIDDGSDIEWMMNGRLEAEIKSISPLVKLYHIGRRVGLIRGRVFGAERATGEVLTFLDSHCECSVGKSLSISM